MEGPIRSEGTVRWGSVVLFLITLGVIAICVVILGPFLPAITGAIVLAVVTRRPHEWIAARLKNSSLAAATSVVVVTLSLIGPALFLGWSIGRQALIVARFVQDGTAGRSLQRVIDSSPPRASAAVEEFVGNLDLNQALERSAGFVVSRLTALLSSSISAVTQILFMLFLLFFAYRDRVAAVSSLRSLLPATPPEADLLLSRLENTIQATVLGRFVVASIQGLVAGCTFLGLAVQGASLLGIATALCSVIPSVGAFMVWVPVAIYLAATHHWIRASILVGIGALIISTLDNFLYPVLVGTRLQMHAVPIFLSIVGGIWFFGIPGLILGPVVFTAAESLLLIWRGRASL